MDRPPPTLFHYQRFDANRLRDSLGSSRLYFSKTDHFNDPWDCRVNYRSVPLPPSEEFERALHWMLDLKGVQDRAGKETAFRARPQLLNEYIGKMSAAYNDPSNHESASKYRVYCLSPEPRNVLMWAHYADSFRGACLGFSTENEFFGCARPVRYSKEFPSAGLANIDELFASYYRKAACWEYEQEFRILAEVGGPQCEVPSATEDGFVAFPRHSLVSIAIGSRMPSESREELVEIVQSSGLKIVLKELVLHTDRYDFEIRELPSY